MMHLDKHHKVIDQIITQDKELQIQMYQHHNNFHKNDGLAQIHVTRIRCATLNKCYNNNMHINLYSLLQQTNRWWVRTQQDNLKIWNVCLKMVTKQLLYILNSIKKHLHLSNKCWINNKFRIRVTRNSIKYIWITCLTKKRKLIKEL